MHIKFQRTVRMFTLWWRNATIESPFEKNALWHKIHKQVALEKKDLKTCPMKNLHAQFQEDPLSVSSDTSVCVQSISCGMFYVFRSI